LHFSVSDDWLTHCNLTIFFGEYSDYISVELLCPRFQSKQSTKNITFLVVGNFWSGCIHNSGYGSVVNCFLHAMRSALLSALVRLAQSSAPLPYLQTVASGKAAAAAATGAV